MSGRARKLAQRSKQLAGGGDGWMGAATLLFSRVRRAWGFVAVARGGRGILSLFLLPPVVTRRLDDCVVLAPHMTDWAHNWGFSVSISCAVGSSAY